MFSEWKDCLDPGGVATLRCIPVVFQNVVAAALIFVGIITAFLIVFAGIQFIRSGGDQKQLDSARKTLTYAIIGLVLVLSSFAIVNFIAYTTGTSAITEMKFGK